jgi:hypothetical protein
MKLSQYKIKTSVHIRDKISNSNQITNYIITLGPPPNSKLMTE